MNHVIIVASGSGTRFGGSVPKQFLPLGESSRPVLMHTVEAFIKAGIDCNNIKVAISENMAQYWLELCDRFDFRTPSIVFGGKTRFDSVSNALKDMRCDEQDNILIHDGVRPLVSTELINRVIKSLEDNVAVIPATCVTDSLRHIENDGHSTIVNRDRFRSVQTPQGFKAGLLLKAYQQPYNEAFTDDASVVEFLGQQIHLIDGETTNLKITNPVDLIVARCLLNEL